MTNYSRPGVYIQEVDLPQTITLPDNGNAVGAFVGTLAKGSTTVPVLLTSWIEFIKTFGALSDAYPTTWAAYNFFANGGRNLYVRRVVGDNAAVASSNLVDRDEVDTLTVSAKNEGAWGGDLSVDVVAAGSPTRFGLIVYSGADTVEQYTDLSMDVEDKRYVVSVINSASAYINVTNLESVTEAPDNMPLVTTSPVVLGSLVSGDDGDTAVAADYEAVLYTFDQIKNPIVMNAPDAAYLSDQVIGNAIQASVASYCENRGDCFAILDVASGLTATDALSAVLSARGAVAGGNAAAYYPWLVIPNTLRSTPGATRLQAPGASMVGQYLATDASRGVFKAPAGLGNRLALAVATESQLTNAELDALNTAESPLNAIRQVPGAGIVAMGARTLQNTPNDRYINVRRSLIYIKNELETLSTFAIFENNDERLWSQIRTALGSFLQSYWQQGGLRGATTKDAFFVRCDGSINSFNDIREGRVNIEVGVALEYPAEFVIIKLGQLTGTASA